MVNDVTGHPDSLVAGGLTSITTTWSVGDECDTTKLF